MKHNKDNHRDDMVLEITARLILLGVVYMLAKVFI